MEFKTSPFLKYFTASAGSSLPSAPAIKGVRPYATPIAKTMGMMSIETARETAAKGIVPKNLPTMIESATETRICPNCPIMTG